MILPWAWSNFCAGLEGSLWTTNSSVLPAAGSREDRTMAIIDHPLLLTRHQTTRVLAAGKAGLKQLIWYMQIPPLGTSRIRISFFQSPPFTQRSRSTLHFAVSVFLHHRVPPGQCKENQWKLKKSHCCYLDICIAAIAKQPTDKTNDIWRERPPSKHFLRNAEQPTDMKIFVHAHESMEAQYIWMLPRCILRWIPRCTYKHAFCPSTLCGGSAICTSTKQKLAWWDGPSWCGRPCAWCRIVGFVWFQLNFCPHQNFDSPSVAKNLIVYNSN